MMHDEGVDVIVEELHALQGALARRSLLGRVGLWVAAVAAAGVLAAAAWPSGSGGSPGKMQVTDGFGQYDTLSNTITVTQPAPTTVTLLGDATPANPDSVPDGQVTLGLQFHPDRDGNVTGLRFYKGVGNTGTHVGTLWDFNGTKLAQVTFQNETASGWQDAQLSQPVPIFAKTTYIVAYHTDVGHYASAQASWPITNTPLIGEQGTFCYGDQNCVPLTTYKASNYYVDVDFQATGTPPPAVAPTITALPKLSGTPEVGSILTATNGSWSGDTPITYGYQWQRCDTNNRCPDIPGATSSSYKLADANLGDTIRVVVTATNSAGSASATSDPSGVVAPASVGTGRFTIGQGGVLRDPQGAVFTPVGVNVNGPNWVLSDDSNVGTIDGMARWHFNTIRVPIWTFCHEGLPCHHANDDVDAIVNAYTSRHYVVILDQHDYGSTGWMTPDQVNDVAQWWPAVAARYKDNPYVWFDLANEPTGGQYGDTRSAMLDRWQALTTQIGDAVHGAAPNSILVVEGTQDGQDRGGGNCAKNQQSGVPGADSPPWYDQQNGSAAGPTRGRQIQARYGDQHVVWSGHVYGQWASYGIPECMGPPSDPYVHLRDDMNRYFDILASYNLPFVAGESGSVVDKSNEQWWQAGSWDATHMFMEQVIGSRPPGTVGVTHWHCAPVSYSLTEPDGWSLAKDPATATLTWEGRNLYDFARRVNP